MLNCVIFLLYCFAGTQNCLGHVLSLFGKPITGALSIVFSTQSFGTAENPELVPPLSALRYVEEIEAGMTFFLNMGPAKHSECTDDLCKFIRETFQDPFVGLEVTLGITKLTLQASLGNVAVAKDKCTTEHNPKLVAGAAGRPTVILDDIALFMEYPYVSSLIFGGKPNIGIRAALAVDMARLRGGPAPSAQTCRDVIMTKYDFEEPLLFEASITLHTRYFAVAGIMKGVWRGAFGIDSLYLGNVVLGLDVQYLPSLRCLVRSLSDA